MLTHIQAQRPGSSVLDLHLRGSEISSDLIQLKNVEGLGPVKASVNTTPFATHGEAYTGSAVGKRNIVLTLGLNPDWEDNSIATLRQSLYEYFMPQLPVTLTFYSDNYPTMKIEGFVEGVDPNIFSKDPEVQVSIINPDPDFISLTSVVVNSAGAIDNIGNVPTGFVLAGAISGPGTIQFGTTSPESQSFGVALPTGGSFFEASSVHGDKRCTDLKGLVDGSVWVQLLPGTNVFYLSGPLSVWELVYFPRFGGL